MALPTPLPAQYTLLTTIGAAKLSTALANGTTVNFKQFSVGDGNGASYIPTVNASDYATQTTLKREVYRANIDTKTVDPSDNTIVKFACKIPLTHSTSFTIRELGLFDVSGDLIAVTIVPSQLFSSGITDIYINSAIQITNTAVVNLSVTSAIFANVVEVEAGLINNKSIAPDVLATTLKNHGYIDYKASTDLPTLISQLNDSTYIAVDSGTRLINGKSFDLEKGDLIIKSQAGVVSVLRGDSGNTHIEKSTNYTLTVADLPESEIVVIKNINTTTDVIFTLPAGFTFDIVNSGINAAKTTYTVKPLEEIAIRNRQGNFIEVIGSPPNLSLVGIAAATVTKSTTSSIALTEKSILSGANNITLTLPAIAGVTDGDIYYVKSLHTGVKIDANGAETIDGVSQSINLNKYDAYSFRAAATDWQIVNDHLNERGYATTVTTMTASGTIPATQKNTLINANNIAAVLPALAGLITGELIFVKAGNFTGCTLDAGAETIDGSATTINLLPNSAYTLQKTSATNWQIVSRYSQLDIASASDALAAASAVKVLTASNLGDVTADSADMIAATATNVFMSPKLTLDKLRHVSSKTSTTQLGTVELATSLETQLSLDSDRAITASAAFAGYGFNDPVTKSASATLLESEHLVLIDTTGITITLPTASTIKKSKRNTVNHRVINISGGNAIVAGGVPSLLPLTETLDPTNINAASIPTIVGGALV